MKLSFSLPNHSLQTQILLLILLHSLTLIPLLIGCPFSHIYLQILPHIYLSQLPTLFPHLFSLSHPPKYLSSPSYLTLYLFNQPYLTLHLFNQPYLTLHLFSPPHLLVTFSTKTLPLLPLHFLLPFLLLI